MSSTHPPPPPYGGRWGRAYVCPVCVCTGVPTSWSDAKTGERRVGRERERECSRMTQKYSDSMDQLTVYIGSRNGGGGAVCVCVLDVRSLGTVNHAPHRSAPGLLTFTSSLVCSPIFSCKDSEFSHIQNPHMGADRKQIWSGVTEIFRSLKQQQSLYRYKLGCFYYNQVVVKIMFWPCFQPYIR